MWYLKAVFRADGGIGVKRDWLCLQLQSCPEPGVVTYKLCRHSGIPSYLNLLRCNGSVIVRVLSLIQHDPSSASKVASISRYA